MKVQFRKDYRHTFKAFKKGDIVILDSALSAKLLKEKVVSEFNGITNEEIAIKQLNKDK